MKKLSLFGMACVVGAAEATEKPLALAATELAPKLEAGCIVTGELKDGKTAFAVAGTPPEGTGAAPERVLFEIGSISKTFTGLLLAQAVVEGRVKLETTLKELLGADQTFADPRVGAITLLQLSTHTSGLPRLPGNAAAGLAPDDPYARYNESLLRSFLATVELKGEAPFLSSYSNVGAGLLGHLLGKIYGKSWEAAVVEKLCEPLGMRHTRVDISKLNLAMAPPHAGKKRSQNWTFDAMAGAGALRSTAADMIEYGKAVMQPEKTPLREAFALALQPRAEFGAGSGHIGLGFLIRRVEGQMEYSHDGGTGGYTSMFRVAPGRGLAQVVLINNNSLPGSAVVAAAAAPLQTQPVEPAKEIKLAPDALKTFTGVYEVDQDTRFTVLLEGQSGHIWVRLTGQPFLRFFARTPNRIFAKAVAAEIEFQQADGKVESLTLFQNGHETKARRTAQPPPAITLMSRKELEPYAGKYRVMGLKDMTVTIRADTLFAQLEGQPALPVFATAPDRFDYDVVDAALVFTRDEAKHINGLTLLQNGMIMPAPKVAKVN